MFKRYNRELGFIYNKDDDTLLITWLQNKTVQQDKVDDNIHLYKKDKQGYLSIEINGFQEYIKQHTERIPKEQRKPCYISSVAGIATPVYTGYKSPFNRFISKIKRVINN